MAQKKFRVLPGFGLTMGFTLFYLSAIVLIPFAGLVLRTLELSWADLWRLATTDRALAAYRVTFGASLVAAVANAAFGTLLAWVLVRYDFPGRRFIDAIVDFPFALPTAVAGLTLANLFAANGWLGRYLVPLGIKGAFTPLAVVIALTFVGMPFVVRTLQPAIGSIPTSLRQAAAVLGASPGRVWREIDLPLLRRAALVGAVFAFTISLGEFGATTMLARPDMPTLPVAIAGFLGQPGALNYGQAMAMATILMLTCAVGVLVIEEAV